MPNFWWTQGEALPPQGLGFGDYSYLDGKQVLAVGRPDGVTYFHGNDDPDAIPVGIDPTQRLEVATSNRNFYVSIAGSDSDDGTEEKPFRTVNKAISVVASIYWGSYNPVIYLAPGTYQENIVGVPVFANIVRIEGDVDNPSNVTINNTGRPNGTGFRCDYVFSVYELAGLRFEGNTNQATIISVASKITLRNRNAFGRALRKINADNSSIIGMFGGTFEIYEGGTHLIYNQNGSVVNAGNSNWEWHNSAHNFSGALLGGEKNAIYQWTNNAAISVNGGSSTGGRLGLTTGAVCLGFNGANFGNSDGFCSYPAFFTGSAVGKISDAFGLRRLEIEEMRHLGTVQNTNTPNGATARAMPVYNSTGTLLGYIPIYSGLW